MPNKRPPATTPNRSPSVGPEAALATTGHLARSDHGPDDGLPAGRMPVLRVVPMPADANQHGDIFGGWIMSQVDIAGGVIAAAAARGRVATVAVNSFVFREPVMIGDRVSFYGEVVRIGNTSITVNVECYAERNPAERHVVKVTEATLTYVATDPQRRPRTVPRD
jgi:acyl-CoA thioesterase YciA